MTFKRDHWVDCREFLRLKIVHPICNVITRMTTRFIKFDTVSRFFSMGTGNLCENVVNRSISSTRRHWDFFLITWLFLWMSDLSLIRFPSFYFSLFLSTFSFFLFIKIYWKSFFLLFFFISRETSSRASLLSHCYVSQVCVPCALHNILFTFSSFFLFNLFRRTFSSFHSLYA